MRTGKLALLFLALYLIFLGGSAYYNLIFPVRVVHHVLITLLLAGWLIARLRRGEGLPRTPVNTPLYAMVAVWFVTALLSVDPRMALEGVWFQVTHVLFFFVLVSRFQQGYPRDTMEIQFFMAAVVVLLSGLEIASWYFGLGFVPGTETGWIDVIGPGRWLPSGAPRLSLAMNISTLLAGYVAPLIPLTVGWAWTTPRRDYRRALWLLGVALGVILLLTFSRGGWIGAAVGLGVLGVFRLINIPSRWQRLPLPVTIGLAIAAGAVLVIGVVTVSVQSVRVGGDQERVEMWRGAAAMTQDDPLSGVGPGQFGRAYRSYRDLVGVQDKLVSAHNLYLNVMAETGLPGLLVGIWFVIAFLRGWWRRWQAAESPAERLRLAACLAGLVTLAFHSLVDVFTITPIALLAALLAAYSLVGYRSRLAGPIPPDRPVTGLVALLIVVGYGVWFIPMDMAQARFQASQRGGEEALAEAQTAAALDPALDLYELQQAYLLGEQAGDDPDALNAAADAYDHALALEPTWDTGWLNRAALAERQDEIETALAALEQAASMTPFNTAWLHWARIAEAHEVRPEEAIVGAYSRYIRESASGLPASPFWTETLLRRQALDSFLNDAGLSVRYVVLTSNDPSRAALLVPETPTTAEEWWVVGHARLRAGDSEDAVVAFSEAVRLAPAVGDYHLALANAKATLDREASTRDFALGLLLGPYLESPIPAQVALAPTPEAQERLRLSALTGRVLSGEFAATMYGRPAVFDLLPEVRPLGPARLQLDPVYDQAALYREAGRMDDAMNVYRAILDAAPYERDAAQALADLTAP